MKEHKSLEYVRFSLQYIKQIKNLSKFCVASTLYSYIWQMGLFGFKANLQCFILSKEILDHHLKS